MIWHLDGHIDVLSKHYIPVKALVASFFFKAKVTGARIVNWLWKGSRSSWNPAAGRLWTICREALHCWECSRFCFRGGEDKFIYLRRPGACCRTEARALLSPWPLDLSYLELLDLLQLQRQITKSILSASLPFWAPLCCACSPIASPPPTIPASLTPFFV